MPDWPVSRKKGWTILGGALALCLLAGPVSALTLEEAITLALARNERAAVADEETRAAQALVGRAQAFLLPDLSLTGDYTRRSHETTRTVDGTTSVLQSRDGWEGRATFTQRLFDAQAWPLLSQARHARDAARADAAETKRLLAHESAAAFLTVLGMEQVTQAAVQRLDLARQNAREVRVRHDAQLVGSNDVTRADLEAATAERELVGARGQARVARLSLGYLLGADITDSLAVPTRLLADAMEPAESDSSRVVLAAARRPDVLAARARAQAAGAAAREPDMRYLPDLDFTGTAWRTNESGFSGRDEDWTLGLGLSWQLFDGGAREADRRERRAQARAAGLDLALLERGVAVDVERARVALESQQASLTQAEAAVAAARRNAVEAAELYRQGLARAFETVDANVQLFEAEVERVRALYTLALALLDLRAAQGLDPLGEEVVP